MLQSPSSSDYVPNLVDARPAGLRPRDRRRLRPGERARRRRRRSSPTSHFAIVDVDQTDLPGKPANVAGLLFREQQVGYLAGYLAGLVAQKAIGFADSKPSIGSVGGQKQPPVDRYIAGYQAGAQEGGAGDPDC